MKVIMLTLLLILCSFAQYNEQTTHYNIEFYRINDGYEVPVTDTLMSGKEVQAMFELGYGPSYISPYTRFHIDTKTYINTPDLWQDTVAYVSFVPDYPMGNYEILVNALAISDSDTIIGYCQNALLVFIDSSDISLPISMNFFEAVLINGDVVITWITQSELQNCFFNIYRKERNGEEILLTTTNGQGSTSVSTTYGFTDTNVMQGHTYIYRLESVSCSGIRETEGKFTIFVPVIYGIALYQNYPNPANPITTIGFKIDEPSLVKLFLYDVNGRRSAVAIEKRMGAGEHKVNVDCSDIASGTYFYVLRVHNLRTMAVRILTKKMTILR